MTNAEKFVEVFGTDLKRQYATKSWWEQEFVPANTGHWIEDDMTYCGVELTNYKCDKCGEIGGSWRKGLKPNQLPKYCQWCGAKMGEMKE